MTDNSNKSQDDNEKDSEYVGIIWGPNFLKFSAAIILFFLLLFLYRHCKYGDMGGGIDGIDKVL